MNIPTGWTDQTSQVAGEATLLRIQAPSEYGSDSAAFMIVAIPGPKRGSSAHELAVEDAAGLASLGPQTGISDCTVGGENASFYQYQESSGTQIHRLLVLHAPTSKYPLLYAIAISSQGQVDVRAAGDIRAILGSWSWGKPIYDPNA